MHRLEFSDVANFIATITKSQGKLLRSELCDAVFNSACSELNYITNSKDNNLVKLSILREKAKNAIEMIHYASLLHDDILDDSKTRRGEKSVHISEGAKKALISGDVLFAKALQCLGEIDQECAAVSLGIAGLQASAVKTLQIMCEAQMQETLLSSKSIEDARQWRKANPEESTRLLLDIVRGKTGALFGLAAYCGALFAIVAYSRDKLTTTAYKTPQNTQSKQMADFCSNFTKIGEDIGIYYQLVDDLQDKNEDEAANTPTLATTDISGTLDSLTTNFYMGISQELSSKYPEISKFFNSLA